MRLTVLASGSKGNCTVVASERTAVLVDAGLSCREILRRLALAGEDAARLDAVIISHEHSDHVAGLDVLARRLQIPIFMTVDTYRAWRRDSRRADGSKPAIEKLEHFSAGRQFAIGDIEVRPFTVPHDAADPVGFAFRIDGVKTAIVTDLGYLPASVRQHVRNCDVLMIESNHDVEMLREGPYPWSVKQRVMSRVGHLSNAALAEFFMSDYDGGAACLVLAHLSERNNHPEVARMSAEQALHGRRSLFASRLLLASQSQPLESVRI